MSDKLGIRTGVQLTAVVENAEQGKEILKRHEQRMTS
jgi:hypothetical protein